MNTLQTMLLTLLLGASMATGSIDADAPQIIVPPETAPQSVASSAATPQPIVIYVTPEPTVEPAATPTPQVIYVYVTPEPTAMPVVTAALRTSSGSSSSSTPRRISTGTSITRELYRGCSGGDVSLLQTWLAQLGYSVSADGDFGLQTYYAVCRFQQNNGLTADGIAGANTIRALVSGYAVGAQGGYAGSGGGGYYGSFTRAMALGDSGEDVLLLQQTLASRGYNVGADGYYGNATFQAVYAFQLANGISADGVAGIDTLRRLFGSGSIAPQSPTQPPWPAPPPWPVQPPWVSPSPSPSPTPTPTPVTNLCPQCGQTIMAGQEGQHAQMACGHHACVSGASDPIHTQLCPFCSKYRCQTVNGACTSVSGKHSWEP